jgi:hypothetical protein
LDAQRAGIHVDVTTIVDMAYEPRLGPGFQLHGKATTPVSAMSYRHMGFDWSSEAIANAVGRKRISYIGGNLCLSLLIQASNCCCDWR